MIIRSASSADWPGIWAFFRPIIAEGETYALPADISPGEAQSYWFAPAALVCVAEQDGAIIGSYTLRANRPGPGSHVANAGYITAPEARGRGVARRMLSHSLEQARQSGFTAMQFNFVISTNTGAVRLWHRMGFATIGRQPAAFAHPRLGLVDALVMHRFLY